jgi:hypothetical protein
LLLELPPVGQHLPELELPVVHCLAEVALALVCLFRFFPAPETNSISSKVKTRINYSYEIENKTSNADTAQALLNIKKSRLSISVNKFDYFLVKNFKFKQYPGFHGLF